MNKLEEKIAEPFAVKILKSFYADSPQWAKTVMIWVAVFLGSFITYVQANPAAIPEIYQKYVPGVCFVGLIILQVIPVNKSTVLPEDKFSKKDPANYLPGNNNSNHG